MTPLRTRSQPTRLVLETQLHGVVAITIHSLDLQHFTRPRLNDSHRHDAAIGLEYLRHADFAAQDTFSHVSVP